MKSLTSLAVLALVQVAAVMLGLAALISGTVSCLLKFTLAYPAQEILVWADKWVEKQRKGKVPL